MAVMMSALLSIERAAVWPRQVGGVKRGHPPVEHVFTWRRTIDQMNWIHRGRSVDFGIFKVPNHALRVTARFLVADFACLISDD